MTTDKMTKRGFAMMDSEQRTVAAKKGGRANRKQVESEEQVTSKSMRGFAAMDEEKRREIAKRGGSTVRRNRIDWKEQVVIL